MFARARKVLAQGHSAIADAAFLTEAERCAAAEIAKAAGSGFCSLFLTASPEVRARRIGLRRNDASDATEDVALLQEGMDTGTIEWTLVDAAGTPEQTYSRAAAFLPRSRT
jgi:uncharacterized protein